MLSERHKNAILIALSIFGITIGFLAHYFRLFDINGSKSEITSSSDSLPRYPYRYFIGTYSFIIPDSNEKKNSIHGRIAFDLISKSRISAISTDSEGFRGDIQMALEKYFTNCSYSNDRYDDFGAILKRNIVQILKFRFPEVGNLAENSIVILIPYFILQ